MKKILPAVSVIIVLVLVVGVVVLQKSQTKPTPTAPAPVIESIKKVDLTTQPVWVQKLVVTAKKGVSGNGLANFTLSVAGISPDVKSLTYVVQYQTANKGAQGALAMSPQMINGGKFTKLIDLGTCSTKSCVRHDGVTSVDVELDFSDSSIWTGTLDLK